MEPNEYQCENCLGVFTKSWSDQQAEAEATANGFDLDADNAIVCDDCYKAIMRHMGHEI